MVHPVRPHPAGIAQLGERQTEDLKVAGSIPAAGISFFFFFVCFSVPNPFTRTYQYPSLCVQIPYHRPTPTTRFVGAAVLPKISYGRGTPPLFSEVFFFLEKKKKIKILKQLGPAGT